MERVGDLLERLLTCPIGEEIHNSILSTFIEQIPSHTHSSKFYVHWLSLAIL